MKTVDLAYAFGLPPEKALEYFRSKGYRITWDWHEMLQEAHAKAFTVAKVMRIDILEDIRTALDSALQKGTTLQQFKKDLIPTLQKKGWWGEIVNEQTGELAYVTPRRLDTIYRVNLQTSYMAGRYRSMTDNVKNRPYWQYIAVLDGRTRPSHRALHGKVFRYDDPIWRYIYPPNGFRCRCRIRALSAAEVETQGLKVESSAGRISFVDQPLGSTGQTVKVASYRGIDAAGKEFTFTPDVGWDYNPGAAWQKPFTSSPTEQEFRSLGSAAAKTPLHELPAKPFTADMLLPPHQKSGWSEEQYIDKFLGEFGASIGNPVVYRDKIDDAVVISEELFRDRADNKLKVFKADREIYLPLLADTIKDPTEIWLLPVEKNGRTRICKRYIGLYDDGNKKVGGFVVFDLVDGEWRGTTTYKPRSLNNLDKQREGSLLYTKK